MAEKEKKDKKENATPEKAHAPEVHTKQQPAAAPKVAQAGGQQPKPAQGKEKVPDDEIRGIIRVAGKDVKGHIPMHKALRHIKGVGKRYADVCAEIAASRLHVDENIPIGKLTDVQLDQVEEIISHPLDNGLPSFMLNKRREFSTGKDVHLISNDLDYSVKQDIDREMKGRTWRGISHMYRKKVRGQRTRTSGRKGGSVGVVRKKAEPGKAPAKKEGKK